MKQHIINGLIGLLAVIAFVLILSDSDNLILFILSKVLGGGLFFGCSRLYEAFNEKETV